MPARHAQHEDADKGIKGKLIGGEGEQDRVVPLSRRLSVHFKPCFHHLFSGFSNRQPFDTTLTSSRRHSGGHARASSPPRRTRAL